MNDAGTVCATVHQAAALVAVAFVRRSAMRRFGLPVSVAAVVLLGIVAVHAQPVAIAQEATPATDEMMAEGVTFEPATMVLGVDLASPSDMLVFRIGLEPGAVSPVDPSPGAGILLVESGTMTVQVDGSMTVTRGAGLGEAMATAEASGDMSALMESLAAGEAVTLEAGDAAYIPGNVPGEIRNEGQEPAAGLAFIVYPAAGMMGEATPAP
jgi:quercetin dioxygenase-like cupin family protein